MFSSVTAPSSNKVNPEELSVSGTMSEIEIDFGKTYSSNLKSTLDEKEI